MGAAEFLMQRHNHNLIRVNFIHFGSELMLDRAEIVQLETRNILDILPLFEVQPRLNSGINLPCLTHISGISPISNAFKTQADFIGKKMD